MSERIEEFADWLEFLAGEEIEDESKRDARVVGDAGSSDGDSADVERGAGGSRVGGGGAVRDAGKSGGKLDADLGADERRDAVRGDGLLAVRGSKGLTQVQAAAAIGVSEKTWRAWEQHGPSRLGTFLLKEAGWL